MHTHIQISMNVEGVIDVAALRRVAIQLAATPALATVDTREMATHVQVRQICVPPCGKLYAEVIKAVCISISTVRDLLC